MKKALLAVLFLAVAFAACGQPADVDIVYSGMIPQIIVWDAVTTDINGEPLLVDDIVTYNIYYAPAPGVDDYTLGGVATTPDTVTWTLSRTSDGSIINSRENVSIGTPSTTNTITLTAADLAILTDTDIDRTITCKMVYTPGSLPYYEEDVFTIKPLSQVANG